MTGDAGARRNVLILAIAQGLYSSAIVILIATSGLVGVMLAPSKDWATLPVSAFVVGAAISTIPASLIMQRFGRRNGFLLGTFAGFIGALLAIFAIFIRDFTLFCLAAALHGTFQASSGFFRFAAADISSAAFKPKAISWVMTGGVAAAVFGTLLVISTTDLLAPVAFAGCYVASAGLALATLIVLTFLDIPNQAPSVAEGPARPFGELLRQPRLIVAVACAVLAYGMMNLMMTATPIAMIDCGFDLAASSWVIQWHVLAMFVPSFFTGHLIARFGVTAICATGMVLLAGAGVAGLLGIGFGHFAAALILLGLGWNFGFIGGTTMLTDCYRPTERGKVQALNDFSISATMAVASLSSGKLLSAIGWDAVSIALFPMAALALGLIAWQALLHPARRPA